MSEKVLVTGGAGFVGRKPSCAQTLGKKYGLTVLDNLSTGMRDNLPSSNRIRLVIGDVRGFELVSTAIKDHEYVFHLAAQAFIPLSYELPLQIAERKRYRKHQRFQGLSKPRCQTTCARYYAEYQPGKNDWLSLKTNIKR